MISVRSVSRRFGPELALDRVDLEVAPGETVVVIGPNGSGKTTLLRIVAGLLHPSSGVVELAGGDPRAARHRIGYLGHEPYLYPHLTVIENLILYARLYEVQPSRPEALLDLLDMSHKRKALCRTLSRGETQRVALARSLLHDPDIFLADEPFSGLDHASAAALPALLCRQGRTLLFVTHDLERGRQIADRVAALDQGRLAAPNAWRGAVAHAEPQARPGHISVGRTTLASDVGRSDSELRVVGESADHLRHVRAPGEHCRAQVAKALIVASKDLRSEARGKEILAATVPFAVVLVFVFTFALPPGSGRAPVPEPRAGAVGVREVSAALLWAALLFAGTMAFGRNASLERESGRIEGLLLAPVDTAALFAAKATANLVYLLVVQAALFPLFAVFFDVPAGRLFPGIVPVALAADVGLAGVGTLLGAASQHARAREMILPLLAFPILVPLLLGAIRLTSSLLIAGEFSGQARWFILMAAFDLAISAMGAVAYEYVVRE